MGTIFPTKRGINGELFGGINGDIPFIPPKRVPIYTPKNGVKALVSKAFFVVVLQWGKWARPRVSRVDSRFVDFLCAEQR